MAFVVVMTMALVTALALLPCATTLLIKSSRGGIRSRRHREAATRARIGEIFGYDTLTLVTESPANSTRAVRPPVMQYANSEPVRKAG